MPVVDLNSKGCVMTAKQEALYDKNRVRLADRIPLDTPYTLNIEPSSLCNLRCKYCGHSSEAFMRDFRHDAILMRPELFSRLVSQIGAFPRRLKVARLSGYGEPLLHPDIAAFIRALKAADAAEQVAVFSNATALTHELSRAIVDAGLDRILISVNGLSDEDYARNTGRRIDFAAFVSEIEYLFSVKEQLQVDLKIADTCLLGEGARERFFERFGSCCDRISVESAHILIQHTRSYGPLSDPRTALHKYQEFSDVHLRVCPLPFYTMTVMANGNVDLCSCVAMPLTAEGLTVETSTLKEIWDGAFRREVLLKHLQEDYTGSAEICGFCPRKLNFSFPQDSLDGDRERLIRLISGEQSGE